MEASPSDTVFEFDSGGPDAWSPYGRWSVQLDGAGRMELWHHWGGQTTPYGPADLSAPDSGALWQLIDALDIAHLESSTRPPVPDEGAYTLRLREEKEIAQAHIWRHDALRDPQIAALVAELTRIIEQVTGVAPILR